MSPTMHAFHISLQDAIAIGPPPPGNLATPVFAHGTLEVEIYAPIGKDRQKPHSRDEIYIIARGHASFFDGQKSTPVTQGAFLFVPAGCIHRFEDFSKDFLVWVAFYGPEGGEAAI